MEVRRLEHYNIRTTKFEESIAFYTGVMGFRHETPPRPAGSTLARKGAWFFDSSGAPSVHMAYADPNDPKAMAEINAYLGERDASSLSGSGAVDHVAFEAVGFDDFVRRCQDTGSPYTERVTPTGMQQLFITDPNGIRLELNFKSETPAKT